MADTSLHFAVEETVTAAELLQYQTSKRSEGIGTSEDQWYILVKFYILLTCIIKWFLVNDQRDAQILFYVFISIYNSLHVSSTQCLSSGETIISIQPLVTVYVGGRDVCRLEEYSSNLEEYSSNLHLRCRSVNWWLRHQFTDRQRIGYNIPQAVLHSLMLQKMSKTVARNMSS